jgi:AAT family amino acid transporter
MFSLTICWIILAIQFFFSQSTFYAVLISISGFTSAVCWIMICLSQVAFRRRIMRRGYTTKDLRAPAPLSPFLPIAIGVVLEVIGLCAMPFSETGPLGWAFAAAVICLIVPVIVFAIVTKGKTAVATRLPYEKEFDLLYPDNTSGAALGK